MKMRIEHNLLRRNLHTNGHHHHNGNGVYTNNNNSNTTTTTKNKKNQEKEVEQDIPLRKSALQETEIEEQSSFLNPELQRELNRILAEADGDAKLSHDSEDSSPSASSSSSMSSASSEEEDEYEHPRYFLEEIAEEDEEEEEEEEDAENDDEDDEGEGDEEDDEDDFVENDQENPIITTDDDKGELEESCSDFASDSDATITNEQCIGEEIEANRIHEINGKSIQAAFSSKVSITKAEPFKKQQEKRVAELSVEKEKKHEVVLYKGEEDDSESVVENEWGNEQIDETPKETSAEHARGETGISTETDYQEPVESEQQLQYQQQPHSFNHLHKGKNSKQAIVHRHTDSAELSSKRVRYSGCISGSADVDGESVSEVSEQSLEFLHQQKKKQHEHPKEATDQLVYGESTKSVGTTSATYSRADACTAISTAGEVDEENEEDEETEDDDDDDGESSCTGSTTSGSSNEALEESGQEQKKHGHVEIRLFHDIGSSPGGGSSTMEEHTSKYISREWNRESKCRAGLVDLQTSTSSEVHGLMPESPGESGTGSSSSISSSPPPTSPSLPFKSSLLPLRPINSSNLLERGKARSEDVSVCDSCTKNISPRPAALPTIIQNKKFFNNSVISTSKTSYSSAISSTAASLFAPKTSKSPSILITSPKPSPTTEVEGVLSPFLSSGSTIADLPKKKRVSFQEHIESKTYSVSDEPSSVALSASNFNKDEKEYSDDEKNETANDAEDTSAEVANEQQQELNSSFSASSSYSDSANFYNNSQFSTSDFWAIRNGTGGAHEHQQQQFLQPVYYSESENSSSKTTTEEAYPNQHQQSTTNNHHYYYPIEYFTYTVSEPVGPNNSIGRTQGETQSSPSSHQTRIVWKKESNHHQQQTQEPADIHTTRTAAEGTSIPSSLLQTSPTRPTSVLDNNRNAEMHQRLSGGEQIRLRSVLRKPGVGGVKKSRGERSVTFNESLNLFYEAECSCWIHEDDYHRLRQEEQQQQQQQQQQQHHHQHQHHQHHQQFIYEQTHPHYPHTHHQNFIYEPPPIEFEDPPTLSPPEGYKDRFFPQEDPSDPDVTRVGPPSPPSARRKVFLKENSTDQLPPPPPPQQKGVIPNGLEDEEEDEESKKTSGGSGSNSSGSKGSRLGGILKGGRLWRSNSAEGKKVTSPPEEPDVVKCTERENRERLAEKDSVDRTNTIPSGSSSPQSQVQTQESHSSYQSIPTKVSTGTAPLRTSEQIRLAVDSTLRLRTKKTKPECSSLVEKLRWLTSLDDDDPSDSSSQSGFATWPSRDKNGSVSSTSSSKKSDAGTSTNEEFVNSAGIRQPPPIYSSSEAKIKQISYTLEDIDEGLKGSEIELESFITEDGGRIERLKKRYSGEEPGDDYGFSRRPSVKGIKPKFSSTNQIFAQYTAMRASGTETPVPVESQYENTRGLPPPASFDQLPNHLDGARLQLNYDVQNTTGRPPEESRAHFEMIRQSFEHASFSNFNRPHSWSVSTLPHPHHAHAHSNSISLGSTASPVPPNSGGKPANLLSNNFGSTLSVSQPMQQPQNNLSMNPSPINMNNPGGSVRGGETVQMIGGNPTSIYGTLPSQSHMVAQQNQVPQPGQPIYGTVRRVPNVIGRPLFLHYGALSVEAHPNKIVQPFPRPTKVPETPSPTQQPPPLRYYGPPIRYYNSPPPVPPRSVTTTVSGGIGNPVPGNGPQSNSAITDCQQERGVPEGATDEEPSLKESYSMNV